MNVAKPEAAKPSAAFAVARRPARARGTSRRVLVVDDNPDAAEALAVILGLDGHEVRVAHGCDEALQLAAELRPDVILLEVGLPLVDGYEVARRLRCMPQAAVARIVALTADGGSKDRRKAADAGFDDYFVKPIAPSALRILFA